MPILEIPAGLSGPDLLRVLNDRLRSINEALEKTGSTGITTDFAGARLQRVGDATFGTDALNLRKAQELFGSRTAVSAPSGSTTSTILSTVTNITAATIQISEHTLTAGTTNITSPGTVVAGQLLAVKLTQDATGGRQITWSADFSTLTTTYISDEANKTTVFLFVSLSDLKWYPVAAPFLEA